jgi:tRNA 2-thiouridine synthesizing protein E
MTTEFETMRTHQTVATQTWNEELAQSLANERGIGKLTPEHWHIIHTLRQHYIQYSAVPPMRYVCDTNRMDPHCVDQLFHSPQEAWQIAGLPAPNDEAQGYSYPGDMVQH